MSARKRRLWSPERVVPDDPLDQRFLLERVVSGDHTWVGMSSDAMLWHAIMRADGYPDWWPADEHDLARCEETYRRAPLHLKRRMLHILKQFRRHVAEGGLYCVGCDTNGHRGTIGGRCNACDPEAFARSNAWLDQMVERGKKNRKKATT